MRQRSRRETASIASDQSVEAIKRLAKQPGTAKDIAARWRQAMTVCETMAKEWENIAATLEAPYRLFSIDNCAWLPEEYDESAKALRAAQDIGGTVQIWKGDVLYGLRDEVLGFRWVPRA